MAFSTRERFVINAIESKTIVPLLKKELSDLREIAQELDEALKVYEEQLAKILGAEIKYSEKNTNEAMNKNDITM